MKLAAAVALALLAVPAAAHAGGYVSAGVGTAPRFSNGLQNYFDGADHNSARVFLGKRFGIISIEGGLSGYGVNGNQGVTGDIKPGRAYTASASIVGQVPILAKLEGFARLGVEKTWITGEADDRGIDGNGYVLGFGAAFDLGIRDAAIWAEVDHEMVDFHRENVEVMSGAVDTLMVGVRFGFGK